MTEYDPLLTEGVVSREYATFPNLTFDEKYGMNDLFARIVSDKDSANLAQRVLIKYGFEPATSAMQLAHKLAAFVMKAGETALRELAKIHPDKELIMAFCESGQLTQEESEMLFLLSIKR